MVSNIETITIFEGFPARANRGLTPAVKSVQLNLGDFNYAA